MSLRCVGVWEYGVQVLDVDLGGTLSFAEMRDGLRRMNFEPPIELTSDDFSELTERGLFCNADGGVDLSHFDAILTAQVSWWCQAIQLPQQELIIRFWLGARRVCWLNLWKRVILREHIQMQI